MNPDDHYIVVQKVAAVSGSLGFLLGVCLLALVNATAG